MKAKLALFVAIALGIVAAIGVHNYLRRSERKALAVIQPVRVLAYAKRLIKGTIVMPHMLKIKSRAKDAVTVATVLERDKTRVFGQRLVRDVETNQHLEWGDFEEKDSGLTTSDSGPHPGFRAITIGVDNVSGVAGNVRPGSHVDIFGTFQVPEDTARRSRATGQGGMTTKSVLLLSDVVVLATDNRTTMTEYALASRRASGAYSTITVAVTPREALMLVYAQQFGKVSLGLRTDGDVVPTGEVSEISEKNVISIAGGLEQERRRRLTAKTSTLDDNNP